MTLKVVAMDIETDTLDASRIWVICGQDVNTGETYEFHNPDKIIEEGIDFANFCDTVDLFVFHNGIAFDVPVINRLLGKRIDPSKVLDTLVVSRFIDYNLQGGHSLKAWGKRLSDFKMDFNDFSKFSQEMVDYCHQDVALTVKLYQRFLPVLKDQTQQEAIKVEHDIQILCEEMHNNGFFFDKEKAEHLLDEIELRMLQLEDGFQEDFPPQLEEVNRILYRKKSDGDLTKVVKDAIKKYPKVKISYDTFPAKLICMDWVKFKPSSPKMRIERLWDAGWKPVDKTKGHIEYDRENKPKFL